MTTFQCKKCKVNLNFNAVFSKFDGNKQYILCDQCISEDTKLYTKSFCINNLLLSLDDLVKLKYLFMDNINITIKKKLALQQSGKYYLDTDIENFIKIKYGDIKQYNEFVKIKKNKLKTKRKKSSEIQHNRKKFLIAKLNENKLKYKNYGDCYTFVNHGFPDIDTLIKNELNKADELDKRKQILKQELEKINVPYSEKYRSLCYDYIYKISNKSLEDTIKDAKIENFFCKNTIYPQLCNDYPPDVAKNIALNIYIKNKYKKKEENEINQ